ncbi:uncharacterized protein LOC134529914 [Bacillus rossius redtenbacheri]|uniref:uncharacterized protein LOC134529914 n=1 Tax=Bacillus rossius redtenbacheri TaxID=93214 RepID=UPI002FDE4299
MSGVEEIDSDEETLACDAEVGAIMAREGEHSGPEVKRDVTNPLAEDPMFLALDDVEEEHLMNNNASSPTASWYEDFIEGAELRMMMVETEASAGPSTRAEATAETPSPHLEDTYLQRQIEAEFVVRLFILTQLISFLIVYRPNRK